MWLWPRLDDSNTAFLNAIFSRSPDSLLTAVSILLYLKLFPARSRRVKVAGKPFGNKYEEIIQCNAAVAVSIAGRTYRTLRFRFGAVN